MYSFLLQSVSCASSEDFYSNPDPDVFIDGFRRCDIAALILCCAAGHPPVPENASGELLARCHAEFTDAIAQENSGAAVRINHSRCAIDEYNAIANLALRYGIFHHDRKPDRSMPVRFQVCHVKIANPNSVSQDQLTQHTRLAPIIPALMTNNLFFNSAKQRSQLSVNDTYCGFKPGFLIGKRF